MCGCLYGGCVVFGNVCMVIVCLPGCMHVCDCVRLYGDCVVLVCVSGHVCLVVVCAFVGVCMFVNVCA